MNFKLQGVQVIARSVSGVGGCVQYWLRRKQVRGLVLGPPAAGRKGGMPGPGPSSCGRTTLLSSDLREFMNGSQRPGNCSQPPHPPPPTFLKEDGRVFFQCVLGAVGFPCFSLISITGSFRNGFGRQFALNVAPRSKMPWLF